MAGENPQQALIMITRVEQMCGFIEDPDIVKAAVDKTPFPMPHHVGSLNYDIPFWVGFGTVALWAALDAFSEREDLCRPRCDICRQKCLVPRFPRVVGNDHTGLGELEDIRHLYAHNYAGEADNVYFTKRQRHVLDPSGGITLTCGAPFDGRRAQLNLSHLRHYCGVARRVLATV